MNITRRMNRHGLVTTEISGRTGTADILNATLELGRLTAYSNQWWEIFLLDPCLEIERNVHTTMDIAHRAKEIIQFKARGAVAIVAPSHPTARWSNQVASLLRGDVVPVTVFEDESQARRWLGIHMERAQIDATTVRRPRLQFPQAKSISHGG
jgi:hypothetical protein